MEKVQPDRSSRQTGRMACGLLCHAQQDFLSARIRQEKFQRVGRSCAVCHRLRAGRAFVTAYVGEGRHVQQGSVGMSTGMALRQLEQFAEKTAPDNALVGQGTRLFEGKVRNLQKAGG